MRLQKLYICLCSLVALTSCNEADVGQSNVANAQDVPTATPADQSNRNASADDAVLNSSQAIEYLASRADPDSREALISFAKSASASARQQFLAEGRAINEKNLALTESNERLVCGRRLCEILVACPPREPYDDTPGVPGPDDPDPGKIFHDPDDFPIIGLRLCRITKKNCEEGPPCDF